MKLIAPALLILGLCALPGYSQDAPKERPRKGEFEEKMQAHMAKALNLTEAQKTAMKDIRAKHKAALEAKRAAAETARKAFMEAVKKPETPADALKPLHRTQADANLDLLLEHRAMRIEMAALLTPEQKLKAARLEGRMEGMMAGRRGRMHEEGMR